MPRAGKKLIFSFSSRISSIPRLEAPSISTKEAVDLAVRTGSEILYDEQAQAPYFFYTEDGVSHQVYYEDARSISARLMLLEEYSLRGALYWNLMRRNEQNLLMLNYYIDIVK